MNFERIWHDQTACGDHGSTSHQSPTRHWWPLASALPTKMGAAASSSIKASSFVKALPTNSMEHRPPPSTTPNAQVGATTTEHQPGR